jgi:hypothetical protein
MEDIHPNLTRPRYLFSQAKVSLVYSFWGTKWI